MSLFHLQNVHVLKSSKVFWLKTQLLSFMLINPVVHLNSVTFQQFQLQLHISKRKNKENKKKCF